MARFRADVEGCGCIRCQGVGLAVRRRSLPAVFRWSARLPIERPSIAVAFLAVGLGQAALLATPGVGVPLAAVVGVLGAAVGRGYVGILGRAALGGHRLSPSAALRRLARRLPAFLAAGVLAGGALGAFVWLVTAWLAGPVRTGLGSLGAAPLAGEVVVLVGLAAGTVYLVTKLWFLPEACFVGGYGPIAALRVSWHVASLRRAKVLALVGGFGLLLGLGVLFDARVAAPDSPVVLSLTVRETTVVLRSFGLSAASGARFAFDVLLATGYSGVFVHHYVGSVLER